MKKHLLILSLVATILLTFTACGRDYEPAAETVTVRFYYHSAELDPNIYALPEAFLYNAETIPAKSLEEEFIRLMHEYTGIRILDLRFVEAKLYINLHEEAISFFDHHGSAGGLINATIFEKTIASLPGINSFEVLVDEQRGVQGHHFSFNYIAIVENGEVVRHEFF